MTNLLVDLELKTGQIETAADRARNQLVRGNSHFGLLFQVAETLIESGQAEEALPLFRELRDPMIEVSEQDKFVKLLSGATERLPDKTEPLEMLADFCRHTSDPFHLNVALTKLADIYEAAGNDDRAETAARGTGRPESRRRTAVSCVWKNSGCAWAKLHGLIEQKRSR